MDDIVLQDRERRHEPCVGLHDSSHRPPTDTTEQQPRFISHLSCVQSVLSISHSLTALTSQKNNERLTMLSLTTPALCLLVTLL